MYVHDYQGHLALDHCQGLSIDYVPEFKHRIIHESQDNSNRGDLSDDPFPTGNVQNEKDCGSNLFPIRLFLRRITEGVMMLWTAFCVSVSEFVQKRFCCCFIYKAQEGPGREHLQCSQSHFAVANKHAVKIKVSRCNTGDIIRHPIPAVNDKALSHLHTVCRLMCVQFLYVCHLSAFVFAWYEHICKEQQQGGHFLSLFDENN